MQPTRVPLQGSTISHSDDAFAALLAQQTRPLARYASRLTRSTADADDLVQDTMLRCWTGRQKFTPGTYFAAWARTVMRNSFISGQRRARFQADLSDDALDRLLGMPGTQEWAVQINDMHWALSELTPDHRDAVMLAGQGWTIDEAARELSISPGTYKSRLARGRSRLRSLNEDVYTPLVSAKPNPDPIQPRSKRRDWTGVMIG